MNMNFALQLQSVLLVNLKSVQIPWSLILAILSLVLTCQNSNIASLSFIYWKVSHLSFSYFVGSEDQNTVKMLTNNQLQAYLKVCPSTCSNNQGVPGKSHPWWRLTISITCYVSHTASSVARSSSNLKKSMSFLHNSIPTDALR